MASPSSTAAIPQRKKLSMGQLLVNGQWRDASDGTTMPTFDPTTEEKITDVAKASPADAGSRTLLCRGSGRRSARRYSI
jgi:aldehyde dehydrogenase (NAD+)